MACRTVLRCVFLSEPSVSRRPFNFHAIPCSSSSSLPYKNNHNYKFIRFSSRSCRNARARQFRSVKRFICSVSDDGNNYTPSYSGESSQDDQDQGPPQEAVLKAISEVSKTEGRVGQTTNVVIGGTVTDDSTNEWLALDQNVNKYPTVRGFTAIGTGGDDFVQAMVVAVESVIQQPIPKVESLFEQIAHGPPLKGNVKQKISSRGKYVSVNIGPVHVVSSEQVQAVYNAMRRDDRMKYFL